MTSTLSLYRSIIKAAKAFPSIKRNKIVEEIRVGFRANAKENDAAKVKASLDLATKGLSQLSAYTSLPKSSGNWSVNMDNEPMPRSKG